MGRCQDPNVRDPRNGFVSDMMRVECLKMDLQMETPRKSHSGERRGWWGRESQVQRWWLQSKGGVISLRESVQNKPHFSVPSTVGLRH